MAERELFKGQREPSILSEIYLRVSEDHLGSARTFEGQRGRGVYLDEITGIKSNDRNENRRFYLFFVIFRNENTILSLF